MPAVQANYADFFGEEVLGPGYAPQAPATGDPNDVPNPQNPGGLSNNAMAAQRAQGQQAVSAAGNQTANVNAPGLATRELNGTSRSLVGSGDFPNASGYASAQQEANLRAAHPENYETNIFKQLARDPITAGILLGPAAVTGAGFAIGGASALGFGAAPAVTSAGAGGSAALAAPYAAGGAYAPGGALASTAALAPGTADFIATQAPAAAAAAAPAAAAPAAAAGAAPAAAAAGGVGSAIKTGLGVVSALAPLTALALGGNRSAAPGTTPGVAPGGAPGATPPGQTAPNFAQIAQNAVTRYGQMYTGRNPRHIPRLNQWVGQQLSPYF